MEEFQITAGDVEAPGDSARISGVPATIVAGAVTLGVCLASPLLMGLTGDATWYALPLLVAVPMLWRTCRLSRHEIGLRRSKGFYSRATLLPLVVVGGAVWLATLGGVARVGEIRLGTLGLQVSTMALITAFGALVTEDGFFRGALWGLLERGGRSTDAILLWTSTAYVVWYLPILWVTPSPVGGLEAFLVHALNLWLLALCWGVLRLASGSILVTAWAHGLWSGLAYTLFGFGDAGGAMGVVDALRFDPERGWAGVALNTAALLMLWRWWRRQERAALAERAAAVAGDDRSEDPAGGVR